MEIFILTSLVEAMPMALLEAMASRRPVVATRVGSIPMIIKNGYSGILIEPRDITALTESIIYLLKETETAKSFVENGYEIIKNQFSSTRMANDYIRLYHLSSK